MISSEARVECAGGGRRSSRHHIERAVGLLASGEVRASHTSAADLIRGNNGEDALVGNNMATAALVTPVRARHTMTI